jgi:hypothetical protein
MAMLKRDANCELQLFSEPYRSKFNDIGEGVALRARCLTKIFLKYINRSIPDIWTVDEGKFCVTMSLLLLR